MVDLLGSSGMDEEGGPVGALGGSEVHVFYETLITYVVRLPVATQTSLPPAHEREGS